MTWLQFTLWLAAAYACYYLLIIFIDAAKSPRPESSSEEAKLISFEKVDEPEKVMHTASPIEVEEPVSIASGGVNLKGLFDLARKESIHYTVGISF